MDLEGVRLINDSHPPGAFASRGRLEDFRKGISRFGKDARRACVARIDDADFIAPPAEDGRFHGQRLVR
jgi:hypothetical protein